MPRARRRGSWGGAGAVRELVSGVGGGRGSWVWGFVYLVGIRGRVPVRLCMEPLLHQLFAALASLHLTRVLLQIDHQGMFYKCMLLITTEYAVEGSAGQRSLWRRSNGCVLCLLCTAPWLEEYFYGRDVIGRKGENF